MLLLMAVADVAMVVMCGAVVLLAELVVVPVVVFKLIKFKLFFGFMIVLNFFELLAFVGSVVRPAAARTPATFDADGLVRTRTLLVGGGGSD